MASAQRGYEEGGIYHVYNRGNRKNPIFLGSEDYATFLFKLQEFAARYGVTVLAYCLMPNHYHLLLRQESTRPLSRLMQALGSSYSQYFNWQHQEVGCLCQGRYGARRIGSAEDLVNVARYIHLNPQTFTDPKTYSWSDLRDYYRSDEPGELLKTLGLSRETYLDLIHDNITSCDINHSRRVGASAAGR